ncbi:GxxExxY protein [Fodinibius sp. SL11]|uniref:GxxExxY protein n=1 Tax=Fodinibius sp. SL11 TaxID=3425690 RepID=UPI003F8849B9
MSRKIIRSFYDVYNELGTGFLELVYENSFYILLNESGLDVEQQVPISVYFKGHEVGKYVADLIIENKILIELKSVSSLLPQHDAQILNYLKATDINIGLMMNFGDEPEFKRLVFERKRNN